MREKIIGFASTEIGRLIALALILTLLYLR
jgi:hypothetical protein